MTQDLNERLINVRYYFRLSQKEFGEKLGVTRNAISNYEIGRVIPKELFLQHLCEVFNVNEKWLKTGEGNMFNETIQPEKENIETSKEDKNLLISKIIKKMADLDEEYLTLVNNMVETLYYSEKKKTK